MCDKQTARVDYRYRQCCRGTLLMVRPSLLAASLLPLSFSVAVRGQESPKADVRLESMSRRAGLLKMTFPDHAKRRAPELSKSPVLRCNDPTREEVDGTVWLWVEGKRPVAESPPRLLLRP
jgi:hypothetical protein